MSEVPGTTADAVVSDTSPPVETPAAPEPAAPSMEESMRAVWDKHHPDRDPLGRFASREAQAQESEPVEGEPPTGKETTDQPEATVTEQAGQRPDIELPPSWSGEMKQKLAALPPEYADLQRYAVERDKAQNDAIIRHGQQIKAFEPLTKVVDHYRDSFQRNGVDPHEGIARLLDVETRLANDPANTLIEIAAAYNIDLPWLAQAMAEQQQGGEGPRRSDPAVAALEAKLQRVESLLTERQQAEIAAERGALSRRIDDFAKEAKDGQSLRPHFDRVSASMARLVDGQLAASDPTTALEKAYEQAIWSDPDIRTELLVAQQKAEQDKRAEEARKRATEAKKAAAVNQRSSIGSGASPRTMDDTLREVAAKAYGAT